MLQYNKIIEFIKKYEVYVIIFTLILTGIVLWKFDYLTGFTGEWASCVDYIKEGVLYHGQPKCYHGPINFFLSYILMELFPNSFLQVYELVVLISSLLIFFLIYKIIKKLNLKHHYLLLAILFFTLIYIPPINNNSGDSIYSTLIMLYGFYVLYFSKNYYYKYLFSSFLFTVSIFTRLNVLMPIALILVYHFKDFFIKEKKLKIDYQNLIKALTLMFIPPFIIVVILRLIFQNVIAYSILTQFIVEDFSLTLKLKEFFSGISLLTQLTFLILVLLIPLYWFYKKKDIFSFVVIFGLILITYGTLRGHHGYFQRYYVPIFPFLIIIIIIILNKIKLYHRKLLFIFLILILSLSAIKLSDPYLTSFEFRELRNIIDKGFSFIPEQHRKILSDNAYLLKFNKKIDPDKVDIIQNKYAVDGLGGIRIETLGLLDLRWKDWRYNIFLTEDQLNEILNIGQNIINKNYSLIIIGPSGGYQSISSPVSQTISYYSLYKFNKTIEDFPYSKYLNISCVIDFPSLMDPCQNCRLAQKLFFTEYTEGECDYIINNLVSYYKQNLKRICRIDQFIANRIAESTFTKNFNCNSNKSLLQPLSESKIATFKEGLLILFIIALVLLYYYLTIKKENTL
ncbi:hypothetical protein HYV88_00495 [Candidatus Woesearchaeota archaeon]|nr:hypothetical protein [Candidatus Woesearchaeota archaeon]